MKIIFDNEQEADCPTSKTGEKIFMIALDALIKENNGLKEKLRKKNNSFIVAVVAFVMTYISLWIAVFTK